MKGQIKKAEEKLAAAKSLREDGFQDDAISRAYYVMFHAGSAALLFTVESHSLPCTLHTRPSGWPLRFLRWTSSGHLKSQGEKQPIHAGL
ncbi:MAG: HEPN domain-containing protein [Nitrospirae bacterium]|nr:HEPN domain-containing protein [Nitrospirota bacterium]